MNTQTKAPAVAHTPEPWICHSGMIWATLWEAKGGLDREIPIAYMDRNTPDTAPTERDRNAIRIAICVNACAGMADPAATITTLREALEGTLSWLTSYPGEGALKAYDKARAALAQIKGTP